LAGETAMSIKTSNTAIQLDWTIAHHTLTFVIGIVDITITTYTVWLIMAGLAVWDGDITGLAFAGWNIEVVGIR
jgi:hypothetical protein